jgi:hypothetical protein
VHSKADVAAMEPLSILAIATSVVQFLDFAGSLLGETAKIHKSAEGFSDENADLHRVTKLKRLPCTRMSFEFFAENVTKRHKSSFRRWSLYVIEAAAGGGAVYLL